VGISYYFIGAHYWELKKYDKALEALNRSLEIGKEVRALQTQNIAYKFLSLVYEANGQFKKALEAQKLYKITSDSLINEKTIKEITQAKMQFEYEKQEKIRETERKRKALMYILIILGLTLGFIIVALLYWG
jgi:Tetratricopeptide repeat.